MADDMQQVPCPICGQMWRHAEINNHVNRCLNDIETIETDNKKDEREAEECQPRKRLKSSVPDTKSASVAWAGLLNGSQTSPVRGGTSVKLKPKKIIDKRQFASSPTKHQYPVKPDLKFKIDKTPGDSSIDIDLTHNEVKGSGSAMAMLNLKSGSHSVHKAHIGKLSSPHIMSPNKPVIASPDLTKKKEKDWSSGMPLAETMRPKNLKEFVGQQQVLGQNKLFRSLLEAQNIPSMLLWGPPGCGKTTLARIIAEKCKATHDTRFVQLSATTAGIAEVKEVIKIAHSKKAMFKQKTILFIDEVHRFNKSQQDTFLPHVEDGSIVLIGATTENPSFQVNNALLSRCRVIVLEKLSKEDLETILCRALKMMDVILVEDSTELDMWREPLDDTDNIEHAIYMERDGVNALATLCDGDARSALNSLQTVVESKKAARSNGTPEDPLFVDEIIIKVTDVNEILQRAHVQYDRTGEEHYNCASALQKSIRGSDDSGAIYWLARMLEGGEDALFIARRLVVTASEDIGLADPQALPLAVATFQACHFLGMPECRINLAHCTTYLARASKSTESYQALTRAQKSIRNHQGSLPGVPLHLRNAPTKLMKNLGYGAGYKYNPAFKGPVQQSYLPESLRGTNFFKD